MSNWVGQQLGNYHLIRQLGKGSFGQVYLGEHTYLKTHAAIKLLLEDLDEKQEEALRKTFLQEAQRIAALNHPHILRVLDFSITMSAPYLVMEYTAHGTLLDRHPHGSKVPIVSSRMESDLLVGEARAMTKHLCMGRRNNGTIIARSGVS